MGETNLERKGPPMKPTNGDYKRWAQAIEATRPDEIEPVPGVRYVRADRAQPPEGAVRVARGGGGYWPDAKGEWYVVPATDRGENDG